MILVSKEGHPSIQFSGPPKVGFPEVIEPLLSFYAYDISKIESFSSDTLSVGIVRHPYDWLASAFIGVPKTTPYQNKVMCKVLGIVRISPSFRECVQQIVETPGILGEMFEYHKPDSIIRCEDFPWSLYEILGIQVLTKFHEFFGSIKFHRWNSTDDLVTRKMIVDSEQAFCQKYNYV